MKRFLTYCTIAVLMLGVLPACALANTAESPIVLGDSGDVSCFGTLSLPNGCVILSLSVSEEPTEESESIFSVVKAWLVCLAPNGSIMWENTFGSDRDGGYTTVHYLALNDDGTFCGTVRYEIEQCTQYHQKLTFSCADGSILSEGDQVPDTSETDKIYRNYYPDGNAMLVEEIHDGEASCEPRILRMLGAEGNELWQLDTADIGLNHMAGWIATEKGALLYGCHYDETTKNSRIVAMLIDTGGRVVWTYQAANVTDGDLNDAIVDSNGRFIGLGFSRDDVTGSNTSSGFSQLVFCLDAATGNEIWFKLTEQTDRKLPSAYLMETDGQYVLCTVDSNYTSNIFEALDQNGRETNYWTVSTPEYGRLSPKFFLWDDELWTETLLAGSALGIMLERVVIPDGQ